RTGDRTQPEHVSVEAYGLFKVVGLDGYVKQIGNARHVVLRCRGRRGAGWRGTVRFIDRFKLMAGSSLVETCTANAGMAMRSGAQEPRAMREPQCAPRGPCQIRRSPRIPGPGGPSGRGRLAGSESPKIQGEADLL